MRIRLREPAGLVYHGTAVLYALAGYAAGIFGILADHWGVNIAATLLLAHALVIAAYMVHECAHNTVFKAGRDNTRLGRLLTWICGAAYGRFEDIRFKHFRHHVDNDDVAWFDYRQFFDRHPIVLSICQMLEWCYIPAHEILMHAIMALTSFVIPQRRNQRERNVAVLVVRISLFATLAVYSPRGALLFLLATMMMMQTLRFMDMLQHDYDYNTTLFSAYRPPQRGDRDWEQAHTFSNPHTLARDWPNWLTLNFGFHNAHHASPETPWYRLPALHRQLAERHEFRVIPLGAQLKIFSRFRVQRIMGEGEGVPDEKFEGPAYLEAARQSSIPGGNAASFLTAF